MSDYLAHLVERSFAPAPRIRPQLASLFEQPSATAALETPAEFDQALERNVAPPRATVFPDLVQFPPARVVNARETETGPLPSKSHVSIHAERTDPEALPMPSAAVVPALRPSDVDRSPMIVRATEELNRHTSDEATHPQPADSTPLIRHDASSPFTLVPPPGKDVSPGLESNRDEPSGIRTAIRPSSIIREVSHRSGSQQSRKDLRAYAPPANSSPAPSIQVTIGRVEVRVTPPTAPAKTVQKKEPALSLDAYLQRRSQGGGR